MRQRLDDPVFQFSNSTIGGNSVATVLSNTAMTQNSATGWMITNSAGYAQLIVTVNKLASQLSLMGAIRSV